MFNKVREFHEAFGHPINKEPDIKEIDLRMDLIDEEHKETQEELSDLWDWAYDKDTNTSEIKRKLTKELADLLYVIYGTAVSFGLPLDEVFDRVHKSNMSKLGDDGKPVYREDGKVLKGNNYKPVDLSDLF